MSWFTNLSPNIQAAIIGATVTLIGILLKEVVFKIWSEGREKKETSLSIYKRYAAPLTSTTTSLFWRLNEIFNRQGRGGYLRGKIPKTTYDSYKRQSTVYRLGCLIGWVQAYKKERFLFEIDGHSELQALDNAISSFESALADGPHVEIERLRGLAQLWRIELPTDEEKLISIGIKTEQIIKQGLNSIDPASSANTDDIFQKKLCEDLMYIICDGFAIKRLPQEILNETTARAMQTISIKEAWLYRDWQAGIGDLMMQKTNTGNRRFDIIGFREFESLYLNGDDEQLRWIKRIDNIISDLDIYSKDYYDARIKQLKNIFISSAKLIRALSEIAPYRHKISQKTLTKAIEVIDSNQ